MFSEKTLVPRNIETLKPYVAGKTIKEVREIYNPERISKLASNENRLGCSEWVKPAVLEALKEIQDYPDPIARSLKSKLAGQIGCRPEQILVAAGSESVLSILCRTFFLDNENAVTADVTFVGFFVQAGVRGVHIKKIPLTEEYRFDTEGLLSAVDEQTKMVYLANPNNPTGTYINKDEYEYLIENLPQDILLINDEAYYEYARELDDYPDSVAGRPSNVIILRTFSKAYGLAGFRIGYAIADEELITEMMKTKLTFEPTAAAQAAAEAALEDRTFLKKSIEIVEKGKKRLYSLFDRHGIEYAPSAANSVLMICKSEKEAETFTQKMLEKGVILRQVGAFGMPQAIRITIGTQSDMDHFELVFNEIQNAE